MNSPYIQQSVCPSPVGLVLSEHGAQRNAMTCSFFSEVAHHPTSLWASIRGDCLTHDLIERSGVFSLIVLHVRQSELAGECGAVSGRNVDKCQKLALHRAASGVWFMQESMVSIACRVRSTKPVGEHTLFIADILEAECNTANLQRRHLLISDLA